MVEHAESSPAGHCHEIQILGRGTKRSRSLANRIAARSQFVPNKLLRFSPGIYFAGDERRLGTRRTRLILTLAHHRHELVLDGVGSFRRFQTESERFMKAVALIDEILAGSAVLFARRLKILQLFGLQSPNHVKPRAILEFLKVHLSTPSNRH